MPSTEMALFFHCFKQSAFASSLCRAIEPRRSATTCEKQRTRDENTKSLFGAIEDGIAENIRRQTDHS